MNILKVLEVASGLAAILYIIDYQMDRDYDLPYVSIEHDTIRKKLQKILGRLKR